MSRRVAARAAAAVVLAAAFLSAPAAASDVGAQQLEPLALVEVGAEAGLGLGKNPTRGLAVMCQRQFDGEEVGKATAINLVTWRQAPLDTQLEVLTCFSGGRQNHRDDYLAVAPDQTRSLDWGVRMDVEKTLESNLVHVTNTRDEEVFVSIRAEGRQVFVAPKLPIRTVVEPHSTRMLVNATRFVGAPDASFVFKWRAEPVVFAQSASTVQVGSKDVVVSVRHTRDRSVFTVFNNRKDPDPVRLMITVNVMPGSERRNLILSDSAGKGVKDSSTVRIDPGQKLVVMTVKARSLKNPWYYSWDYKWEIGNSPMELFGLDD